MQFYATDMIPMTSIGNAFDSFSQMVEAVTQDALNSQQSSSRDASVKSQARIDLQLDNPFAEDRDAIQDMLAESRGLF